MKKTITLNLAALTLLLSSIVFGSEHNVYCKLSYGYCSNTGPNKITGAVTFGLDVEAWTAIKFHCGNGGNVTGARLGKNNLFVECQPLPNNLVACHNSGFEKHNITVEEIACGI